MEVNPSGERVHCMATNSHLEAYKLEELPLFKHVPPESVEGVLERCRLIQLEKNDTLMRYGGINHDLYIILEGELGVRLDSQIKDPIIVLGRGDTVGEMSLIDHKGASAHVCATSDCTLLAFDEDTLWELVSVSHAAACNLLAVLTSRLRNTNIVLANQMKIEYDFHQYGTIDALTGLHSRYWLDNILPRLIRRNGRGNKPMSLIMTDIDYFKDFNTRYGHLCGDRVIHSVARVFTEHLRPSELAARYGGDEFIVLLPGVPLEHARIAAGRLQRMVAQTVLYMPDGAVLPTPTISVGIAEYKNGDTPEQFIAAADAAMYRAKDMGRDTVSE